jgi:hypothetical protein
MSDCPSQELLARWLDAGPAEDMATGLAAHLEVCSHCQGELERLTALGNGAGTYDTSVSASDSGELGRLRCLLRDTSTATGKIATPKVGPSLPGYEILDELGRGGMGIVYKARQVSPSRLVAVKMIRAGEGATPEEVVRFGVEAETVARLQHPNIVQIYEVGVFQQRPYFALEYVAGGNLDDRLAGRPLPARQAAGFVEAVAHAIHHAHERGIVHRDLKPANVLLTADSTPKVADFGMARLVHADLRLTRTGMVAGTPNYMAPEQARPGKAVGPAADVYALGAILYETLTGRPPFTGETSLDVLRQVNECDPVPPARLAPLVPRDLETICLKCLAKEPRQRYATAAALADDLRRFLDGKAVKARPVGPVGRGWRWARRNPLVAAALGLVLFTVAGAFVWIARERDEAKRLAGENAELAEVERGALKKVQDALAKETTALKLRDVAAKRFQAIHDYLIGKLLAAADPRRFGGRPATVREILDQAAAGVGTTFGNDPDLEQTLRLELGSAYVSLGLPREAAAQLAARVALCRRLHGDAHAITLAARSNLVSVLLDCGDFATVLKESDALLEPLRKVFGPEHAVSIRAQEDSGLARLRLGQNAAARKILEEVVAVRRRLEGAEKPDTLRAVSKLAVVLVDMGQDKEALRLCEQEIPVCRRVLGPDHGITVRLRAQHAFALQNLGRLPEAQQECEEILAVVRRTAGPEHSETLIAGLNLAFVLHGRARHAEACKMFAEYLPPVRRRLGVAHPEVLRAGRIYGTSLVKLGRHAEAEPLWRELLTGVNKSSPANPLRVAESEVWLGICLTNLKRFGEAEPLLLAGRKRLEEAKDPPPAGKVEWATTALVQLYEAWGNAHQVDVWRGKTTP